MAKYSVIDEFVDFFGSSRPYNSAVRILTCITVATLPMFSGPCYNLRIQEEKEEAEYFGDDSRLYHAIGDIRWSIVGIVMGVYISHIIALRQKEEEERQRQERNLQEMLQKYDKK